MKVTIKSLVKIVLTLFLIPLGVFLLVALSASYLLNGEANNSYYIVNDEELCVVQLTFEENSYGYFTGNNEEYDEKGVFDIVNNKLILKSKNIDENRAIIEYDKIEKTATITGKIGNDIYNNKEFKHMDNFFVWFKLITKYGQN